MWSWSDLLLEVVGANQNALADKIDELRQEHDFAMRTLAKKRDARIAETCKKRDEINAEVTAALREYNQADQKRREEVLLPQMRKAVQEFISSQ